MILRPSFFFILIFFLSNGFCWSFGINQKKYQQYESELNFLLSDIGKKNKHQTLNKMLDLAKKNFPPAMHALADIFLVGDGCEVNKTKAILWYMDADEKNYLPSTLCLGIILLNGEAGTTNMVLGYYYLLKVAFRSPFNKEEQLIIDIANEKVKEKSHLLCKGEKDQAFFMLQQDFIKKMKK
jgi:hypothetical protein